jgi:uncharacterized Fe-S cluster protein YjdI
MSPGHQRTYETDAIRVHWDSSRCIHTGICLRTLPSVFDLRRRPWVDLRGADANAAAAPTVVWPITDGPLLMIGDLDVRGPDGEPLTHEIRLTLCRCGLSHNPPMVAAGRAPRSPSATAVTRGLGSAACRLRRRTTGWRRSPPRHSQPTPAFPIHRAPLVAGDQQAWISSSACSWSRTRRTLTPRFSTLLDGGDLTMARWRWLSRKEQV